MHTLSILELKEFLQHVAIDMREPVMVWGQPGVGKSEMVQQLSNENNAVLVDVRLSQYDSVDLRGIPGINEGTSLTTWHPPSTLPFKSNPSFNDEGIITLFLDEINSASPSVAAVAYQLINDRRVGEHELRDNVRIIAAGNREGDRGVVNRMPAPLANRFTHAEAGLDVNAFCQHAASQNVPAICIAFIQTRPPLLSTFMNEKGEVTQQKNYATPRTWFKAFKYYASDMPVTVKQAAMAGAVGPGPASEFWGFLDVWKELHGVVEKIIADPHSVEIPTRTDLQYALTIKISAEMTLQNCTPLHTFMKRMSPELLILAWQLGIRRDTKLCASPHFMELAKTHKAMFRV